MYRLAVLADIHGNLPALEAVLNDIHRRQEPDSIWVLGDLVAFLPWLTETIDLLRSLPNARCLKGNTDRYIVTGQRHIIPVHSPEEWERFPKSLTLRDESFRWMVEQLRYDDYVYLRDLPDQIDLEMDEFGRILAVHSMPGDDEVRVKPDAPDDLLRDYLHGFDIQLLLFGHSHIPMQRKLDDVLLVNPGSVGFSPNLDPIAVYGLLEIVGNTCRFELYQVEYPIEPIVNRLQQSGYPGAQGLLQKLSSR
jgi:predicted phosphodiesterase